MSNTPHELAEDFPGMEERIHTLKTSDNHFARLMEQYHEINGEVHRAETHVQPVDPLTETELRKKRMVLKDEIARMLAKA